MKVPNFIGIGAQRCATSWIYAGLYEHPDLCLPFKEINFFSRPRYEEKGIEWYLSRWNCCSDDQLRGEYSTSYLCSDIAAERIHKHIPEAQLLVCLRNPVDRAFSSYYNDIRAGDLPKETLFEQALDDNPKYIEWGRYAKCLRRYFDLFSPDQILVMIYDDIQNDPQVFMQRIYRFLGVDDAFVPSTLHERINVSRKPRRIWLDRIMLFAARVLRAVGLHRLVWFVKKSGVPKTIRSANTQERKGAMRPETRRQLQEVFRDDVKELTDLLGRDLEAEWL